ncbi:hypothetical protein [Tangfeifania diversioriginum]|nr:hypothetical protein [Tangfeifania diversioriginum]
MVDIAGIVIVAFCIFSAGYFLLNGTKGVKTQETEAETPENNESIVGISKTRLGQYVDGSIQRSVNKRRVIPPEDIEQVFYTREEALLNIDVDIEPLYQPNEEENEGDELPFDDTELVPVLATGASFDDLSEMSEAIQSHLHELSQAHIVKAAKIIRTVNETDLLKQLISQVEGGEQKVASILDRCEAELKTSARQESETDDAEGFDLGKYL